MLTVVIVSLAISTATASASPVVTVTGDDVVITESCAVVVPPGTVVEDTDGDGVIHIGASDIEVTFTKGSVLRGSAGDTRPDEYRGFGIRLNGHSNVTIRQARISGFWCGLRATTADGLTLEAIDASDNRRAYLKSTPVAEDGGDWIFPHNNDANEWLNNYGAAIYVEDSNDVTVRNCTVWHGQNALCLDRVNDSKIYDNHFSFNSGWGIAMWRSCRNVISRNACDFCVRGYSHGVYNRGQDSAGILMFEQNNDNVIAENSATHGGDGFFGFAGREALGEAGTHPAQWYKRRGNSENLLIDNDFSYAPAHGIEMTFSFGNVFYGNRMVENAICGVWGGYSQDTLIAGNHFEGNGEMAYGLERGGINIEHGKDNRIVGNTFERNKCGVHLWWDDEGDFAAKPWGRANGTESKDNLITDNKFAGDDLAFHFRGPSDVTLGSNVLRNVKKTTEKDGEAVVDDKPNLTEAVEKPDYTAYGRTRPVGARKHLRGRQNIIMTEWGPWDHKSPLVRRVQDSGDSVTYDLHKMPGDPKVTVEAKGVQGHLALPEAGGKAPTYTVSATKPGVYPYRMRVRAGPFEEELQGTLIAATWDAVFFKWTENVDPREHLEAWRKLARGPTAISAKVKQLRFQYGWGGPSDQRISEAVTAARLGGDHFGMIAATRLPLPAGQWEFATLSDDGIRVAVDGQNAIENWTWHGPTRNSGTFTLANDKTVEITIEHFEIDGYAALEFTLSAK